MIDALSMMKDLEGLFLSFDVIRDGLLISGVNGTVRGDSRWVCYSNVIARGGIGVNWRVIMPYIIRYRQATGRV